MRLFMGVLLIASTYVVVYYRLMVRHFYEKKRGRRESTFAALFSFPPYRSLPESGKKYARRYWIAMGFLIGCILATAFLTDFSAWRNHAIGPGVGAEA